MSNNKQTKHYMFRSPRCRYIPTLSLIIFFLKLKKYVPYNYSYLYKKNVILLFIIGYM